MKKTILMILIVFPFLLGNQDCQRSTTWGKAKKFVSSSLKEGHPEIDAKTSCSDCHDDVSSLKPTSHNISWDREHGKYTQSRFGYKIENVCYRCHNESKCTSCHQQESPKGHTQYWRLRGHGLITGLDRKSCAACHTADFCDRCHSETRPSSHRVAWGSTTNRHCLSCHSPVTGPTAQQCAFCHDGTPSHATAPAQPSNGFHAAGAVCRSCHVPLVQHSDNGEACDSCHL